MTDQIVIAKPGDHLRQPWLPHVDSGLGGLWVLILVSALVVLPPFFYLIQDSLMVPLPGFKTVLGLENYRRGPATQGVQFWGTTPPLPPAPPGRGSALALPPPLP